MKRLLFWFVVLGVLVGGGLLAAGPIGDYLKERARVNYREVEVKSGKIVAVVNSTGTVKPTRSVLIGSFVSGPIYDIKVDFNSEVKAKEVLAIIDQRTYKANVARDEAMLSTRKAELANAKTQLTLAKRDQVRAEALRKQNETFISLAELDQINYKVESLKALVDVADAQVEQAKANLDTSILQLEYTEIISPVDGVIIDRKIDPGQTVAAAFQAPELFVIAPEMRLKMYIYASVDETDIGLIRKAKEDKLPVRFTVDAYPDELFEGVIKEIRNNSTTTQNVVTYPVVVETPNPDLKLLPGMTASISFQVARVEKTLKIPNAALRFYPQLKQVRPEDRALLENRGPTVGETDDRAENTRSAEEKAEIRRKRNKRHVWTVEGDFLRAVEVIIGISDGNFTELVAGDLRDGMKLVTGIQAKS